MNNRKTFWLGIVAAAALAAAGCGDSDSNTGGSGGSAGDGSAYPGHTADQPCMGFCHYPRYSQSDPVQLQPGYAPVPGLYAQLHLLVALVDQAGAVSLCQLRRSS